MYVILKQEGIRNIQTLRLNNKLNKVTSEPYFDKIHKSE